MANAGWKHGSALSADKKTWRYFSPSTLMSGDLGTTEGCLRKVYYEKVLELKGPEQKWLTTGKDLHAENEKYLLTGDRSHMTSLALSGIHMLPKPQTIDPRIKIEWEIAGNLATAPLQAAGVPIAGFIDCIHWQGTNAGTSDITDTIDPEGTVEVIDWKTTSDAKYIKSPQEVARTLQMTTYGKWALVTHQAEWVRLSHGYYVTKGRHTTRKVSLRVHKDQIDERWEYVEALAGSLKEAIKEDNVDKVPANTRACDAYRGCPHRSYCSAAAHNSLSSLFSSDFASALLGLDKPEVLTVENTGPEKMSLLAKLQAATTPAPGPKPEVALEMKRLALEEITVKYPGIGDTITKLETLGLGLPVLLGEAARVYAVIKGNAPYANGELAGFEFDDPAQLPVVLAEAEAIVAERVKNGVPAPVVATPVAVTSPFPEDAPPAQASPPVEELPAPPINSAAEAIAAAASDAPKKRAGRPKKVVAAPEETTANVTVVVNGTVTPQEVNKAIETGQSVAKTILIDSAEHVTNVAAESSAGINLFVDCVPSCKYESFWPYVDRITKAMAKEYGGVDYRAADNDKPTAFGKYKGFLAHGLRTLAQAGEIPAGNYVLDGARTETGGVVVEAMRDIVAQSGGLLVRGIM